MEIKETGIADLVILQPRIFHDARGYFFESFREDVLSPYMKGSKFVQDNESLSQRGTLRGLHMQAPPHSQAKLVRVVHGKVLDIAVDLRKKSPTYGKHFMIELSGENKTMFYVPEGFAHGFLTLEDNTVFQYKCSNYYNKSSELSIHYNDKNLAIQWPDIPYILSEKDMSAPSFAEFKSPF